MKLSTKGRYAVMAMVDLAQTRSNNPISLLELAANQDISVSYMEQLFAKLRRSGLVRSVRGPGGGYVLSGRPGDITIAEIVRAVDDEALPANSVDFKTEATAPASSRSATHTLWQIVANQVDTLLSSIKLSDVCDGSMNLHGRPVAPPALYTA